MHLQMYGLVLDDAGEFVKQIFDLVEEVLVWADATEKFPCRIQIFVHIYFVDGRHHIGYRPICDLLLHHFQMLVEPGKLLDQFIYLPDLIWRQITKG